MTVSFSDHMLVDFYEDLTLGVLLSVIIDFGKSKFALANGPTRRIDISLLLAVLVILTIQFFDIISPVTALVCSVSTVTLYLKSIELYTGSYLKWFLMEISLSVPLLTALLFNTLFADTFMQLYCVLLVLILVVSVVSYISTGTRIVFFDLYPILFAESVVYQLISYSFFKLDLSELPKVYFSRLFNMTRSVSGVFSMVNLRSFGTVGFLKLFFVSLASLILPSFILYLVFGEVFASEKFLYLFIGLVAMANLLSIKYLVKGKLYTRLAISLALLVLMQILHFR